MPLSSTGDEEDNDNNGGGGCFLSGASVLGLLVDSPHSLFLIFSSTLRERYCPILQMWISRLKGSGLSRDRAKMRMSNSTGCPFSLHWVARPMPTHSGTI